MKYKIGDKVKVKKDINENIRQKILEDGFKIEELVDEELHEFLNITWK